MNCHPSGDAPLQGDDSHIHTMNVQRGIDGHGLYALKCQNCHQAENTPGLHAPPGNPKWALQTIDYDGSVEFKRQTTAALEVDAFILKAVPESYSDQSDFTQSFTVTVKYKTSHLFDATMPLPGLPLPK